MDGATLPKGNDDLDEDMALPAAARNLRLTDAERIALDRLKNAPAGSLKEALATTIVAPGEAPARLAERLADVAAGAPLAAVTPFQAAPGSMPDWMDAVPPAHAVPFFEAVEAGTAPVTVAAEAAVAIPGPAPQATEAAGTDAEAAGEPGAQVRALRLLAPEHAAPEPAGPVGDVLAGSAAVIAGGDDIPSILEAAGVVPVPVDGALEARVREEFGVTANDPQIEPLVSAFAANARLAADASAAMHALHNLKIMLADKLVEEPRTAETAAPDEPAQAVSAAAPSQPQATSPEPVREVAAEAGAPPVAAPPPVPVVVAATAPAPHASLPLELPPEELPQIVSKARMVREREAAAPPAPTPPLPPRQPEPEPAAPPPEPVVAVAKSEPVKARAAERRTEVTPPAASKPAPIKTSSRNLPAPIARPMREPSPAFDMRGFMAGFMLSGAIGLLLYFVMVLAS
ncbi:MAG: hypothetical protein NW223_08005 [Hyphomicrobiaceae bacterium]|nr:hypothetical protein [Hyphomicrobiaceae bacterium]